MEFGRESFRYALAVLVPAVALVSGKAALDGAVSYERDIQPIFAEHCYDCHGPDERKSGYRLDVRSVAIGGGDLGEPAITPGELGRSALLRFVSGADGEMRMPPKGDLLPEAKVALLRQWVSEGAPWPDALAGKDDDRRMKHWAWQPVQRPVVPESAHVNPIDAFVARRLRGVGLAHREEADRRLLIRRLSFGLIGLPPTPERVETFVNDTRPDAYRRLVEELLASPRYGERWGRHWLDVVRFAESNGFETNVERPNAWPYRDYVIQAFNEDKPYDAFIREQIAGDTLGADAATGFLVAGPRDTVESPDPVLTAQQRADELHDMVSTTGSAFIGATVGCARCHNHKFDPISMEDYYALTASLAGVRHGERSIRQPGAKERERRLSALRERLAAARAELARFGPKATPGRRLLLDNAEASGVDVLVGERGVAEHAEGVERGFRGDPGGPGRLPNLGGSYHWWQGPEVVGQPVMAYRPGVNGHWRVWLSWGAGWNTHARDVAYILDEDGDFSTTEDQRTVATVDQRLFADGGGEPTPDKPLWSGFRDAGVLEFSTEAALFVVGGATEAPVTADVVMFEEVRGQEADAGNEPHLRPAVVTGENIERFDPVEARFLRFVVHATNSFEPCLDELEVFSAGNRPRNVALAANNAKLASSGDFAGNPKHKLEHLNDGRYGNDFSWISNEAGGGWIRVEFAEPTLIDRVSWSRDRLPQPVYQDRRPTEYAVQVSMDGEAWATVASSVDRLPLEHPHQPAPIRTIGPASGDELSRAERLGEEVDRLLPEIAELTRKQTAYVGTFAQPEPTRRLHRGDPMQPREVVSPGGIAALAGDYRLAADAPEGRRRMELAEWIASPENPLTARVMVNRIWHYHFGTGIVDTPSDLGLNGGRPSHPELLDWLASEFIASGWSVKHIQRLIVTSATYRQASDFSSLAASVDAGNRLLWRFPPRRLEAEPLRDSILSVSGKLNLEMGGPGFFLMRPNNNYVRVYEPVTDFSENEYRRMVYETKPRMVLDPLFGSFDCPDGGQVSPRRNVSTTPLQALGLLNNGFILKQAEYLAERLRAEAGEDVEAQVRRAFRLAFSREPGPEEVDAAARLVAEHGLPALCRALYNTNEFQRIY